MNLTDTIERDQLPRSRRTLRPGSYVIISVGSRNPSEGKTFISEYGAARIYIHSPEEILSFFDGLELVPPGVVSVLSWLIILASGSA